MNYQNIPRKNSEIKRCFIPKLDALVFFDYGQIEARIAAYYMAKLGETGLLDDIIAGVDVHRRMASIIYDVPEEEVTPEMRDRAKTMFFGMLYGAGGKRAAEILNASGPASWKEFSGKAMGLAQAKTTVRNFREEMPGLEVLAEACERRAKQRGYLELFTGRRLEPEEWGEHKLANALIQGTAADMMKRSIVRTWEHLRESKLVSHSVATIHDELMLDAAERELPYLANAVPNLMDEPEFSATVPIVVEMEYSTTSWAEKLNYPEED